jgi:hypothetical protein
MPMGKNKSGVNCRTCIDCEPMVSPEGRSYRCYGESSRGAPIKKDFSEGQANPPAKAPDWCPHRLSRMTEFQERILKFLEICPNEMANTWGIAVGAFPEKWNHRSGRGALIGHIDRAGVKAGCIRLPPKDQYGEAILKHPGK